jgi:hypothetical protein
MPKISELNSISSVTNDDLLLVVNDPSGAPSTNKITFDNLKKNITKNIVFENGVARANTGNFEITSNNGISVQSIVNSPSTTSYAELYWSNVNPTPANNETTYVDLYADVYGLGLNIGKRRQDLNSTQDYNWQWTKDGDYILPDGGDIILEGSSVISRPMLTPNIEYTGTVTDFPLYLNLSKGHAILHTTNNHVTTNDVLYWMDTRFYTSDSNFSLAQSINFVNIGGINNNFTIGDSSENVLATVNLNDISIINGNISITNLPSMTTFSANNLVFVGGNLTINSMDKTNTVFNFPSLNHIDGNLIVTNNSVLQAFPQFAALKIVQEIQYNNNTSTSGTPVFTNLRNSEGITFYQNSGLPYGPQFPALTTSHDIYINNNVNMATAPVFTNLVTTYGAIEISECAALTAAPAFTNLVSCNGNMILRANPNMNGGLSFPALKKLDGDFTADNCSWTDVQVDYVLNKLASLDGTNGTTRYQARTINMSGPGASPRSPNSSTAYYALLNRDCNIVLST